MRSEVHSAGKKEPLKGWKRKKRKKRLKKLDTNPVWVCISGKVLWTGWQNGYTRLTRMCLEWYRVRWRWPGSAGEMGMWMGLGNHWDEEELRIYGCSGLLDYKLNFGF